MLDVLDLLSVPWRFLEGLNDESRSGRNDRALGLSVLNSQLDSNLQTIPV